MSELALTTESDPASIHADELMPRHLGSKIQFLRNGRLLTGNFRQVYALGDHGRSGIYVHVLLDRCELHGDLYGLSEHLADGTYLAEIQLAPDTEVSLSFEPGAAGASARIDASKPKVLTL